MHVAIIMHGNGQWAIQRGLSSTVGCAAAVAALRTTLSVAAAARVRTLTLYSNCSHDGVRSHHEMDANLGVLNHFLRTRLHSRREESVRISLVGINSGIDGLLAHRPDHHERLNVAGTHLHLRLIIDYSAHDRLTRAAWRSDDPRAPEQFDRQLHEIDPTALPAGPVDLLVRTGDGWCPSDFMLWEVAYAKLHFVDRLWPDFTADDFQQALTLHTRYNLLAPAG
jgi:undecaprenyl diphosphate synthase